jgi:amino acid adenylation domain-containing protein
MVVGVLGILKAGGAYVPLDPEYPAERLSFILADAGVRVVLTHEATRERLPDYVGKVIAIDEESNEPFLDTLPSASADGLAYIIYTSGSTGTPKGVMVTHANIGWLFASTKDLYHFSAQDVWTLFHSYSFDFSVWELWGALLYGGRLVVVPYFVSRSPDALLKLLHEERVTVLNLTPSAFRQLLHRDTPELNLRFVIFGGEALEVQGLRPWFTQHGDDKPQLVNMFGITETTVHVTHRPLDRLDLDQPAFGSPIGRPLSGALTYLVDRHGNPVPIGVPGEICVGGGGLARGYINRADLVADRFIPDSWLNTVSKLSLLA